MLLVLFILIIWSIDSFILFKKVGIDQPLLNRFSLGTMLLLFVLTESGVFPLKVFYLLLIILLSVYLFNRAKSEQAFSCTDYSKDPHSFKRFLGFNFNGILLKWFWGVLLLATGVTALVGIFPVLDSDLAASSFLTLVSGLWMIFLIKRLEPTIPAYSFRDWLGLSAPVDSMLMRWVWPVVSGIIIAGLSSFFLVTRYHQPVTPLSELMDWTQVSWAFGIFLIAAVIAAPFIEEVIFRGFFFKMIRELKSVRWAFWIVALIFGFLHIEQYWGDWAGIGIVMMLGFLLTGFRWRTGSSKPGIILHYTFNIFMVIIPSMFFVISHPVFSEYLLKEGDLSVSQKESYLMNSIDEDERNADAYKELAELYLEQGRNLEEALRLIDESLRIMPERTIFQYTKAEILYEMGRVEEAVNILEMILEKMPDNEEVAKRIREMEQGVE